MLQLQNHTIVQEDLRLKVNGGLFIKKIDGCFSNVIGLSLPWLKNNLEKFGLSQLLLDR